MGLSSRAWKIRIYRKKNTWIRRSITKEQPPHRWDNWERKWNLGWMRARSSITHQRQTGDCWNIVIERAHEIKKKGNSENPGKPRTIVCCFLNYKDKTNILKNAKKLKGKNIFINEDFSHETMELRKELWEKVKKHREEGKIAYLHYRTIVVKRRNDQGLS